MNRLRDRKVLLGVTAGIAAYKSADLVRRLRATGADVRVVMTPGAKAFIAPLTLQALSGHAVWSEIFDADAEQTMGHIELARWADLLLIAPATADFLARMAHGLADDLLSTLCLASSVPVWVAPAMNQQMWRHAATQANISTLQRHGVRLLGPADGEQACGDVGPGRMLEPASIIDVLGMDQASGLPLQGVRVLITAGPTREAIDPVRFISNRSSGKMGYALAASMRRLGADVTLVSGPVVIDVPHGVSLKRVETAEEMFAAVMSVAANSDIFVATAAVTDFRPENSNPTEKLGKSELSGQLRLVQNPDILAAVAALEKRPMTVGFAAQTHDLETYARQKLVAKGIDLIAANIVGSGRGGFEADENSLHVYWDNGTRYFPMMSKLQLADDFSALLVEHYEKFVTADTPK